MDRKCSFCFKSSKKKITKNKTNAYNLILNYFFGEDTYFIICVCNDLVCMLINNAKCKFVSIKRNQQKHYTFKIETSTISYKLIFWQIINIFLCSNYTYNKKLNLH